ncbi:MAG: dodecin family protein [Candidatus Thorarchaeota archaeon]
MKVIELIGTSPNSWEEACQNALAVAAKSVRGIVGIDVDHFTCKVENNKIVAYRADIKVAFKYEN